MTRNALSRAAARSEGVMMHLIRRVLRRLLTSRMAQACLDAMQEYIDDSE